LDGGISGLHKNLAQSKLDPAVAWNDMHQINSNPQCQCVSIVKDLDEVL
jgi:hypothetical protein